jgi:hypothetical protein
MRTRMILALAAVGMLAAACASTASTSAPTTAPAPAAAAATPADTPAPGSPSPTPVPQTDGEGDEAVIGSLGLPTQIVGWTTYPGDVPRQRGALATMTQTMNDPRVTGTVEFTINYDLYPKVRSYFGRWTLTTSGGSWTGPCSGANWAQDEAFAWSCWLTGSGDYAGYTFYQSVNLEVGEIPVVRGVIYEGAPPEA